MNLDPVTQEFDADTAPFVGNVQLAIDAASAFRDEIHLVLADLAALDAALAALPDEKTIRIRVETDGMPGAFAAGAGAGAWDAQAAAIKAAQDAADDGAVSQEALNVAQEQATTSAADDAKAQYLLAMAQRMNANTARDAAVANGEAAAATGAASGAAYRGWGVWGLLTRQTQLFGGALTQAGVPAILATAGGFHILADAIIETAAVVIPATVAFGAFAGAAAGDVVDLYGRMTDLFNITVAYGQNIYPFTGALQAMQNAVKPEVWELFGEGLVTVNHETGEFTTLAVDAGRVLDELGARAAAALTSGGFSQFLQQGPADLAEIGDIIGNIFGTVGNLLKVMPGYAEVLLDALDDVTRGLESFTGSGLGQWASGAFLAFHGFVLWAGLGATAAVALGNAVVGLGAKFGLATEGALAFSAAEFGAGIRQMLGGVQLLGGELIAMSSAEDIAAAGSLTLEGALSALAAVNPLVWVGAALTGLALLADHLYHAANATSDYVTSAQQTLGTVPVSQLAVTMTQEQALNTANLVAAQAALDTSTGSLTAQQMVNAVATGSLSASQARLWGNYSATRELQQQLTSDQKNYNAVLGAAHGDVDLLNQAGITSTQILSANSGQLKQLVIEAEAAYDAQQALALGTGRAAAALNAQSNMFMSETVPSLQKITQAEDDVLNTILGAPQAFSSFQQAIQGTSANFTQPSGLGPSAKLAGASLSGLNEQSLYLANTFYGIAVPALQKLSDSLQQQDVSAGSLTKVIATGAGEMTQYTKGNTEANSVIVSLINNALGPGTVSLQSLNTWVKENSTSLQGMNTIVAESTIAAGSLAGVLQSQLNTEFHQALLSASGASAELQAYTDVLVHNQQNTSAGAGVRSQLIRDLENAGFTARQASGYVDGLSASLSGLHSKTITVGVNTFVSGPGSGIVTGTGAGISGGNARILGATGMLVPGHGTGDTVPAMLTPGEAVVPRHLVPAVAPFLSAHHVPGFAEGGAVTRRGAWDMHDVEEIWAREIWAHDLRGHGRGHLLSAAAAEALLHAVTQPKHLTGLWRDPQYRDLEAILRGDAGPYASRDLLYRKLTGERAELSKSEAAAIAHFQEEIRRHEREGQPGWVRYYEREMAGLKRSDATRLAGYAHQLAVLGREGFSGGGLARSFDQGGYLPVGLSMAYNGTGRPEPVGPAASPVVHVHLHGDLANDAIWERMQVRTLDYNYANTGRPTGKVLPGR